MAIARETDASLVKPLEGAIIRRYTAGATIEAGEAVAMQSDGYVDPAAATAVTMPVGIALEDVASGERVDVVVFGPVLCLSGATVGAIVYLSDTAGEPVETAGTKSTVLGVAESATVLHVNIQTVAFA